jgi:hypothetical protein
MSENKSHLDIESPQFKDKPYLWIQWKGTDVCCDIHCACGAHTHYDGEFFYFFRCPACGQVWESGTHVAIHRIEDTGAKPEPDSINEVQP